MDREKASAIQSRMIELCKTLETEFGVKIYGYGGKISGNHEVNLKFRIMETVKTNDGAVIPLRKEDELGKRMYPNLVGTEFNFDRSGRVKFVGYNTRASRMPFCFSNVNDPTRRSKCDKSYFIKHLSKTQLPVLAPGKKYTSYEQELLDVIADHRIEAV